MLLQQLKIVIIQIIQNKDNIESNKIITNLTNKLSLFERIYYEKYVKYKKKYIKLKFQSI